MKIIDAYTNCPSCKKHLLKNDQTACHAEINVGSEVRNYVFCNRKCMEKKMEEINPPVPDGQFEFEIELSLREKLSSSPEKWLLIYDVKEPKFELKFI